MTMIIVGGVRSVDVGYYDVHVVTRRGVIQMAMEGMHPLCRDEARYIHYGMRSKGDLNTGVTGKYKNTSIYERSDAWRGVYASCLSPSSQYVVPQS